MTSPALHALRIRLLVASENALTAEYSETADATTPIDDMVILIARPAVG